MDQFKGYSADVKDYVRDARRYMANKLDSDSGKGFMDGNVSFAGKRMPKKKMYIIIAIIILALLVLCSLWHMWRKKEEEKAQRQGMINQQLLDQRM